MVIEIYNEKFELVDEILHYESAIFTQRYNYIGDFEVKVAYTIKYENLIKKGYWVHKYGDECLYTIQEIQKVTDEEDIDYILFSGEDSMSILNKRLIIGQLDYNGTRNKFIKKILNENVISPIDTNRKIPGVFIGPYSIPDLDITYDVQISNQFIWESIQPILIDLDLGAKMICRNIGEFIFTIYKGSDRSEYVSFDKDTNNLSNINITTSDKEKRNVAYVFSADKNDGADIAIISETEIDDLF